MKLVILMTLRIYAMDIKEDISTSVKPVHTLFLQRLKDVKLGEPGKETGQQKVLTKLCFFIATGRNAMVVVICAVISYAFKSHGQIPFILTGVKNYQSTNLPCLKFEWIGSWIGG
jgi:hypothetical protein